MPDPAPEVDLPGPPASEGPPTVPSDGPEKPPDEDQDKPPSEEQEKDEEGNVSMTDFPTQFGKVRRPSDQTYYHEGMGLI